MKVVVVVVLVALAGCYGRPPPPAPPRRTTLGLQITNATLPNGLRVVLVRDPRAPHVQVTMRYRVGSADDPPDQAGIAHLVEHLMFQQVLGGEPLFAHLERSATSFNAFTTWDATTYVTRANAGSLDELLSIEAVRVGFRCTTITDSAFVREREVVLNELRQHDEGTEVWQAIHGGAYPAGHPYTRAIGGTEASVGAITREQACAFADAHYATGNAVLVVSGDLDAARVSASLAKFLAKVPPRDVVAHVDVPAVAPGGLRIDAKAPIDGGAVIVAWPLPADPTERHELAAIVSTTLAPEVEASVRGRVQVLELGDGAAPMMGIAIIPAKGESPEEVRAAAALAIDAVPFRFAHAELAEHVFDRAKQTAIYRVYAGLEDGSDRDVELATHLLAGRVPADALAAAFTELRALRPSRAADLVREHLAFGKAKVVTLAPSHATRGRTARLAPEIHDLGRRRDPPDPADASKPAAAVATRSLSGMATRKLANGMSVVLLPLTSVPTIDVRLVFASGVADEPADKRGAALLAANALTWDLRFVNDFLLFSAAGGASAVDMGNDHVSFAAHGLDMHLDILLAGLRRWVRDGRYPAATADAIDALRRRVFRSGDPGAADDVWRAALFGATHPYARTGGVIASSALTAADVARFRADHFTPDNATLVVAGHFDPALANRWVDFLFDDWRGQRAARTSPPVEPKPASIALDDDASQIRVRASLPARAGDRAGQLVAAAMLADVAGDVRHRLGATYGLHAELVERRLATTYELGGWVDAARTPEALELLAHGIAQLRAGDDGAARAFVTARERVLAQLASLGGSATELADRVEHDVELARAPMSDAATVAAVQRLTIADVAPVLAELDLTRATVLMRGPVADVDRAFAVLGRTATHVHAPAVDDDAPPKPKGKPKSDDGILMSDVEDALTLQQPPSKFSAGGSAGLGLGRLSLQDVAGPIVTGHAGYRVDRTTTIGLEASAGRLAGDRDVGLFLPDLRPISVVPLQLGVYFQANGERLWGRFHAGGQLERIVDDGVASVTGGVALGLAGGIDIARVRGTRVGVGVGVASELLAESGYASFSIDLVVGR